MNWKQVDEQLDGQTLALFRNEHGDEIEVRDRYTNPVALHTPRSDRYRVIHDPALNDEPWLLAYREWSEDFGRREDAFRYAIETLMGSKVEDYEVEF